MLAAGLARGVGGTGRAGRSARLSLRAPLWVEEHKVRDAVDAKLLHFRRPLGVIDVHHYEVDLAAATFENSRGREG